MIWLMFLMGFIEPEWQITGTEVYQPLHSNDVLVRDDGAFYVRNFSEAKIQLFDKDGQLVHLLEGHKGKGPGEFTYALRMYFHKGKFYVLDLLTTRCNIYDKQNRFIKAVDLPGRQIQLEKVSNGWVYYMDADFGAEGDPVLYWVDDDFENKTRLAEIDELGFSQGSHVRSDGTNVQAEYRPISKRPFLRVNQEKTKVYLTRAEHFEILEVDVLEKRVTNTLKREEPRIPFDTDWANERYEAMLEQQEQKHKFKKVYPDYFPAFRSFRVDPENRLVIDRWRGRPDKKHHLLVLDVAGNELSLPYKAESYERLAGVHDGWAYVMMFDQEEEEGVIAKCKLNDLDIFVEKYPIEFEGSSGFSISISN